MLVCENETFEKLLLARLKLELTFQTGWVETLPVAPFVCPLLLSSLLQVATEAVCAGRIDPTKAAPDVAPGDQPIISALVTEGDALRLHSDIRKAIKIAGVRENLLSAAGNEFSDIRV